MLCITFTIQTGRKSGCNVTHLYSLSVLMEDIDSDHSMVELWVSALNYFIMFMFLIVYSIKSFQQELEQSCQVFWTRTSHKDIGIPVCIEHAQSKSDDHGA